MSRFHRISSWTRAGVPTRVRWFCSTVHTSKHAASSSPVPHTVTPLAKLICNSIKATGPISVADYMQLCLSHPTEGYYMKQRDDGTDVFGTRGDFITSPEISQVFGELLGIWLLSQWLQSSKGIPRKPKIRLVELGPGRGTLMDDIIRTFHNWPQATEALSSIHLVETSNVMIAKQQEKLSKWVRNTQNFTIHAYASIDSVPLARADEFTMTIAHEFFDALPTHILQKTSDGFREVLVDIHHFSTGSVGSESKVSTLTHSSPFRFVLATTATPRSDLLGSLSPRFAQLPVGTRLEVSSMGWRTAWKIGQLISRTMNDENDLDPGARSGWKGLHGAGLIIDYGDLHAFGSSFRAFKNHHLVDVFETPGTCDLTMNVDFALLKEALGGIVSTHGPLLQSEFLLRMGIRERLAALVKQATSDDRRRGIDQAGRRLIDQSAQGMGAVYRVLGMTSMLPGDKLDNQVWPFL